MKLEVWMPVVWLLAVIVLTVVEVLTYQLVAIWFALGALAALLVSLFQPDPLVGLVVFALVSAVSFFATRPLVRRVLSVKKVQTNADRIIGQTGVVLREILPQEKGRILVDGLDWSAAGIHGDTIPQGAQVVVRSIQGVTAMVEKV